MNATKKEYPPFKEDDYDYEVIKAEESISKSSSKPMVVLDCKIYNEKGEFRFVRVYLTFSANAFMTEDFSQEHGISRDDQGRISYSACIGKKGRCQVGIEEWKGKDRNVIKSFKTKSKFKKKPQKIDECFDNYSDFDDNVPF